MVTFEQVRLEIVRESNDPEFKYCFMCGAKIPRFATACDLCRQSMDEEGKRRKFMPNPNDNPGLYPDPIPTSAEIAADMQRREEAALQRAEQITAQQCRMLICDACASGESPQKYTSEDGTASYYHAEMVPRSMAAVLVPCRAAAIIERYVLLLRVQDTGINESAYPEVNPAAYTV